MRRAALLVGLVVVYTLVYVLLAIHGLASRGANSLPHH